MSETWAAAAPWLVILMLTIAIVIAWFWINFAETRDEEDEWKK